MTPSVVTVHGYANKKAGVGGPAPSASRATPPTVFRLGGSWAQVTMREFSKFREFDKSRDAQRCPCRLEAAPLREAAEWIERYRRFWAQNLNRLDDYLSTLEEKETKKHARKSKR